MNLKKPYRVVGVDPGKTTGAIALIVGNDTQIIKMPVMGDELDYQKIATIFQSADLIILEEPFIVPGDFNRGIKTQITHFGELKGLAKCFNNNVRIVTSSVWKRALKLTFPKNTPDQVKKNAAINRAKELCPNITLRHSKRCKVDNHNFAEAYLIGQYGLAKCLEVLKDI
jgi:hypothetical protein